MISIVTHKEHYVFGVVVAAPKFQGPTVSIDTFRFYFGTIASFEVFLYSKLLYGGDFVTETENAGAFADLFEFN